MKDGIDRAPDRLLQRVRAATSGEYTIKAELGRGGMATVYLARDLSLDRLVAMKVLFQDLVRVESVQDRFVTEARTAARLDHPNIITVYSVKELDELLFIVMKYIQGRTLEQVLEESPSLGPAVIATIATRVAEALHFAHGEGIVHRDVKPSNIMVDTRGRTVVTDFGIAKGANAKSLTVTGSVLGTPAYMSPEQCRGETATPASDQYALGLLTYELLSGRLPFQGTLFELMRAHSEQPPPPLREFVPDVDPDLEETVLRMLEKVPAARWPSLGAVIDRVAAHLPPPGRVPEIRRAIAGLAGAEWKGKPGGPHEETPQPARGAGPAEAETRPADTPQPTLVVIPEDPSIEVGEQVPLHVYESSRQYPRIMPVQWQSEDPSVAEVDRDGVVTGRSEGVAKIKATSGAAVGRVAVTVERARVAALVVTPPSARLQEGEDLGFEAKVLDARGRQMDDRPVVWRSSDPDVLAISEQGRALAMGGGRAEVTGECEGIHSSADVKVESTPAPAGPVGSGTPTPESRPWAGTPRHAGKAAIRRHSAEPASAPASPKARRRWTAVGVPAPKRLATVVGAPVLALVVVAAWLGTRSGNPTPTEPLAGEGELQPIQRVEEATAPAVRGQEEGVAAAEPSVAVGEEGVTASEELPQAAEDEPGVGGPAVEEAAPPPVQVRPVEPEVEAGDTDRDMVDFTEEEAPPPATAGWIEVMVVEGWAFTSVDGGDTRETPAWMGEVPPGERVVRVWRPGFQEILDTVRVAAGDTARLRYELVPDPSGGRRDPDSPW